MKSEVKLLLAFAVTLIGVLILIIPTPAFSQAPMDEMNPWIVPIDGQYADRTYGEWQAEWYKWAALLPATSHPLTDTSDCSTGQSGPVWFLGGLFCSSFATCNFSAVHRSCTIPSDKALLVPILNGNMSFIEGAKGLTEADLRQIAQWHGATVSAEIDGRPVRHPEAYQICRFGSTCGTPESPLFTYTLAPHDNLWAFIGETLNNDGVTPMPDGASSESAADGYYLLIKPMSKGHHIIHFRGVAGQFTLDVTYVIFVQK
ncbi:MAG: hypothetical protein ACXVZV_09105 [Terriglobales bacterium]